MPLNIPAGLITRTFLTGVLKPFVDSVESAANAASAAASNALAVANQKFTMPAQGLTWDHLSPTLRAQLVTTGTTRPAGTGMHQWPDPTVDLGAAAQYPDQWPGDIAP